MDNRDLEAKTIGFRRRLHRIPELDRKLPKTKAFIQAYLNTLSCEIEDVGMEPDESPGFVAFFRGGKAKPISPAIAFRTDMDALPITEKNDIDYKSEHEGYMHACGHDGHMAIMLGFATLVEEKLPELDKNVLLVFQAAEETTGGSADIVNAGILKKYRVSSIYGIHLWPGCAKSTVTSRPGDFMASTTVLEVEVEGREAHVGSYRSGIDALEAACNFLVKIYAMEKKAFPAKVKRLLRMGILNSGTAFNVVPGRATIKGTLRAFDNAVVEQLLGSMREIAAEISQKTGANININNSPPYPALINPSEIFEETREIICSAGIDFEIMHEPLMQSEDFSNYQRAVPGVFLHLGTGMDIPLHSNNYQMDEDVLFTGIKVYAALLGIEV